MVEFTHLVAALMAFGASLANACHNLFVRLGTEHRKAEDAFFVVITISTILLVPFVAVIYYPDYNLTVASWLSFVAAGLVGTMCGMVLLYLSIDRIGASRATPIVASNALIATVLGVALLDETVTVMHGLGVVLIVLGVGVVAWKAGETQRNRLSRRGLLLSLVLPLGSALAFGLEPIFANFGFAEGTPAPVGLAVKTTVAWLGFVGYLWWRDALPTPGITSDVDTRWLVLAGLGYTVFLAGYYVGLAIAPVNVVLPIIITNTLFVVVLSAVFMPRRLERVTKPIVAASTMVVVGAVLVTVFG